MKNTAIKILRVIIKVLRAVLYGISAGHICGCKNKQAAKEEKTEE